MSLCVGSDRLFVGTHERCDIVRCVLIVTTIIIIIIIIIMKHLEAVPGKHSIDSLQKTAILGISHIIRKVLQSET
jgi:hypothetical protein